MALGNCLANLASLRNKVLITGGAGYIGDAVVELLLELGHSVTIVDNLLYGGAYMRGLKNPKLEFINLDITDSKTLLDILKMEKWRAVIHLAAIVGDGACAVNPERTIQANEEATKVIANFCRDNNIHMVFASTCSVYGANNDMLDEDSPTNPLSLYAGTKLAAEKYVKEVPSHIIFRLGTVFGLSTEFARLRCDLIANILTYKAAQGQPLSVFGGDQWRPMVNVLDVAYNIARAALLGQNWSGTYILSHKNFRVIDIANTIKEIIDCEVNITEMKFEDQRNYKVNNSKAIAAGFLCKTILLDGILKMYEVMGSGRIANIWSPAFHNEKYLRNNS